VNLEEAPDVLKVREAAELLRVGKDAIYELCARGDLYAARIGGSLRIPKTAVRALLEGPARTPQKQDDPDQLHPVEVALRPRHHRGHAQTTPAAR
jgi:excisionase family DNA binding protein